MCIILFLEGIFAYLRIKDFSNLRLKFFLEIINSFGHNFCCSFPVNVKRTHKQLLNNILQPLNNIKKTHILKGNSNFLQGKYNLGTENRYI